MVGRMQRSLPCLWWILHQQQGGQQHRRRACGLARRAGRSASILSRFVNHTTSLRGHHGILLWSTSDSATSVCSAASLFENLKDLTQSRVRQASEQDGEGGGGGSVQALKTFTAHNGGVNALVGASDLAQGQVWSAGADWTVKLWRGEGGQPLVTLSEHTLPVSCLMLCGAQLFSGSNDKTIKVYKTVMTTPSHETCTRIPKLG